MPIVWVNGTSKSQTTAPGRTGNGTMTIDFPSPQYTPTTGQFGLVIVYNDQGTATTPDGWTIITGAPWGTAGPTLYAWWRAIQTGDTAPVTTIAGSGTNVSHCGNMAVYEGVDLEAPIAVVGTMSEGTGTPMTAGSVNTPVGDCVALGLCGRGDNEASSGQTFNADTTGVTERLDGGTNAGNDSQVSMYDKLIEGAGATGNGSADTSVTDPWVSVIIAIRPDTRFAYRTLATRYERSPMFRM